MNLKLFIRNFVILLVVIIPISLFVSFLAMTYQISQRTLFWGYLIVCIGAVIITSIFQYKSAVKFDAKSQGLLRILFNNRDFKTFEQESLNEIKSTRSKSEKAVLQLNLSVGYSEVGEYQKALDTLCHMKAEYLSGVNVAVYYNNMANYYMTLGNMDQAEDIFIRRNKILNKFKDDPQIGANITFNFALRSFFEGDYKESEALMKDAKKSSDNRNVDNHIELYLAKLYVQMGREKDARGCLSRIVKRKPMPYVAAEAEKLIAQLGEASDVIEKEVKPSKRKGKK